MALTGHALSFVQRVRPLCGPVSSIHVKRSGPRRALEVWINSGAPFASRSHTVAASPASGKETTRVGSRGDQI